MSNNLLQKQKNLQAAAHKLIKDLKLKQLLNPYGSFKIVGSLKHGLMTWRDIDIDLVSKEQPQQKTFWKISQSLLTKKQVKSLMLVDNTKQFEANRPKSFYIGVEALTAFQEKWKIDLRLISQSNCITGDLNTYLNKNLNIANKKNILALKSQIDDDPKYHKTFYSKDVYEAVINHQITTVDKFYSYVKAKSS